MAFEPGARIFVTVPDWADDDYHFRARFIRETDDGGVQIRVDDGYVITVAKERCSLSPPP